MYTYQHLKFLATDTEVALPLKIHAIQKLEIFLRPISINIGLQRNSAFITNNTPTAFIANDAPNDTPTAFLERKDRHARRPLPLHYRQRKDTAPRGVMQIERFPAFSATVMTAKTISRRGGNRY